MGCSLRDIAKFIVKGIIRVPFLFRFVFNSEYFLSLRYIEFAGFWRSGVFLAEKKLKTILAIMFSPKILGKKKRIPLVCGNSCGIHNFYAVTVQSDAVTFF
jgi:hypothetical protein